MPRNAVASLRNREILEHRNAVTIQSHKKDPVAGWRKHQGIERQLVMHKVQERIIVGWLPMQSGKTTRKTVSSRPLNPESSPQLEDESSKGTDIVRQDTSFSWTLHVRLSRRTVNKFTTFCMRMILQRDSSDSLRTRTPHHHHSVNANWKFKTFHHRHLVRHGSHQQYACRVGVDGS